MKLKKIASLALAGIMAVSMLAGCSTTNPKPNPNPGDDEPHLLATPSCCTIKLSQDQEHCSGQQ